MQFGILMASFSCCKVSSQDWSGCALFIVGGWYNMVRVAPLAGALSGGESICVVATRPSVELAAG